VPHGEIRVHFPLLWAREVVIPALAGFQKQYPEVKLQLVFSEAKVDFKDGYDLIVQVELTHDENHVVRTLCRTRSLIVASPDYLQRGIPQHPQQLREHQCIGFMMTDTCVVVPWTLQFEDHVERNLVTGRLAVSDPQAMVDAALNGLGLIQAPDLILRKHLQSGRLQQVLHAWEADGPSICATRPHKRYMSLRLRVFVDWLTGLSNTTAA
jgi:DNA-binding transcriptional LysR family regulator